LFEATQDPGNLRETQRPCSRRAVKREEAASSVCYQFFISRIFIEIFQRVLIFIFCLQLLLERNAVGPSPREPYSDRAADRVILRRRRSGFRAFATDVRKEFLAPELLTRSSVCVDQIVCLLFSLMKNTLFRIEKRAFLFENCMRFRTKSTEILLR